MHRSTRSPCAVRVASSRGLTYDASFTDPMRDVVPIYSPEAYRHVRLHTRSPSLTTPRSFSALISQTRAVWPPTVPRNAHVKLEYLWPSIVRLTSDAIP